MKTAKTVVVIVGVAALAVSAVRADEALERAVSARQSLMNLNSFNLGILGDMAKGAVEYNAEAAQAAADNLQALASLNHMALWPQGSDNESLPGKTRALPVIWEQYPAIPEKVEVFRTATASMAAVAGDGLEAVQGNMKTVGDACNGCHDVNRAPR